MASNYTPQAGDVIESPGGTSRLTVDQVGFVWTSVVAQARRSKVEAWSENVRLKQYTTLTIANKIRAKGWTLVSRKEVQDGSK